jgi:hypothetical protein
LEQLFDAGVLLRPSDRRPNLVHLIRALATLAGVGDLGASPPVADIVSTIGPAEHLVFVLLDGLGMNTVRRLPVESFLASCVTGELTSICPSTTACALTSLATAQYPNRTAVAGWFTHVPALGLTAVTLPFVERFTGQPLTSRGLRAEDVLPAPSIYPRMTHRPLSIGPAYICDTTYNRYARGGTPGHGYDSIPHAIDKILDRLITATGPTFTHLYLPEVDSICHKLGVGHADVVPLVMRIDTELKRLRDGLRAAPAGLADRTRIVVSADHGLLDVPRADQTLLFDGDPLLDLLAVPPSGDARMPVFHVRGRVRGEGSAELEAEPDATPEARAAFAEAFLRRFGDRMSLVPTEQAEEMELFGPGTLSAVARPRFGDFIGIPFRPATLAYHPPGKPVGELFLGVHAGLSPQEMRVPLCVG